VQRRHDGGRRLARSLLAFASALGCSSRAAPEVATPDETQAPVKCDPSLERCASDRVEPEPAPAPVAVEPIAPAPDPPPPPTPEPDPPTAEPSAERWVLAVDDDLEPFGFTCVFYGGGRPRCDHATLEPLAAWNSRSGAHRRGARTHDRIALHRRRIPREPRPELRAPPREPIEGTDLTIREQVSDGVHFSFVEVDGWLLEAESCSRHAARVRSDLIEWAKRVAAERP
jgi:hypothetical protein